MTIAEAKKVLASGPLKFGCPEQIKAVECIAKVEEIADKIRKEKIRPKVCDDCDGWGVHLCDKCDDEHECGSCGGAGFEDITDATSDLIDRNRELFIEAFKLVKGERNVTNL